MTSTTAKQSIGQPAHTSKLSRWAMAAASLRQDWRVTISVAIGVATATAVITGALLVGDSMRGSLRSLTLDRLGKIDSVVVPGGFFQADGASRKDGAVAALMFPSAVGEAKSDDGQLRRTGTIQVLGVLPDFWELDDQGVTPETMPAEQGVVLNRAAAEELGVDVGDEVTIRLPLESAVPADSPLGRRDAYTEGLPRLEVVEVVPNRGLGSFSLTPNQAVPQIAFLHRPTVADVLDRPGAANVLFSSEPIDSDDLRLGLADFGLKLQRVTSPPIDGKPNAPPVFDYFSLTSDRLLLSDPVVEAVRDEFADGQVQPMLTYLANALETVGPDGSVAKTIPYSIITAVDPNEDLPLHYSAGKSQDPGAASETTPVPVVINDWTAERLNASAGTRLRIAYFEPEVERGQEIERFFDATVTDVVPITQPAKPYRRRRPAVFDQSPTVFNDPDFTPTVPGVTDAESIDDWETPFPLTRETDRDDDLYYDRYRLTPKAFMPLAEGRKRFGSRFGNTTSLRISSPAAGSLEALETRLVAALRDVSDRLGWEPMPIRQQQLAASRGTTPFDALFLSLSFFVILAAVLLIAILFRLGLQTRLRQLGTLLAVGWQRRQVTRLMMIEGGVMAGIGVLLGIVGGLAYAWAVLAALRSWWVGAVTVPFLEFHWTWSSLLIGAMAGWVVAGLTLWWSLRSLTKVPAVNLLAGTDMPARPSIPEDVRRVRVRRWPRLVSAVLLLIALGLACFAALAKGTTAAGGFVGAGMLMLIAALLAVHDRLTAAGRRGPEAATPRQARLSIPGLATSQATRNPLRSTLTIGLMATATFLVVAMAAFQLRPTEEGIGGFELLGRSAQPVYRDLNDPDVRSDWLGNQPGQASWKVMSFRRQPGQDASCNNLYQATRPTVLGVPSDFGATDRFAWASHDEISDGRSPWSLLESSGDGSEASPVPVVIDQNTAMWSLQMRRGLGEVRDFKYGNRQVFFRVVGLLSNSVLQGRLLIGDANFRKVFPEISGYQFFMVDVPPEQSARDAETVLESRLGDVGMDLTDSRKELAEMLAVQNTYLRTFQSLGVLGLLLGVLGLAASQLRSVLERRHELAVLRAIGLRQSQLAGMVMAENFVLLLIGLGCGTLCAVAAVLPYALVSGLRPPLLSSVAVVLGILLAGCLAGLVTVTRVIRMPLLNSLRGS